MHCDRRRHVRQSINRPLYVSLNGSCSGGILYDASESGVALDIIVGLRPQSDDVILHFELSEIGESVEAKARITWTKQPENRVGLEFIELPGASRTRIKKWLHANDAPAQSPTTGVSFDTPRSPDCHDEKDPPPGELFYPTDSHGASQVPSRLALLRKPAEAASPPGLREGNTTVPLSFDNETANRKSRTNINTSQYRGQAVANSGTAETRATKIEKTRAQVFGVDFRSESAKPETKALYFQVPEAPRRGEPVSARGDQPESAISKSYESIAQQLEQIGRANQRPQDDAPMHDFSPRSEKIPSAKHLGNEQVLRLDDSTQRPASDAPIRLSAQDIDKTTELNTLNSKSELGPLWIEPNRQANAVRLAASRAKLHNGSKEESIATCEPQLMRNTTDAPEDRDGVVQVLRSSFGHSVPLSTSSPAHPRIREGVAFDWDGLRQWILASIAFFLLIVSLEAARWIYISPAFDKIQSASDVATMFTGILASRGAPDAHEPLLKDAPYLRSRPSPEAKGSGIQSRKRVIEQGIARIDAPNRPRLQMVKPVASQSGHVSLLPTPDLPEKITLPAYPASALQKNVRGRVTYNASISKEGILRNIRLVGPPSVLSSAVLDVIRTWRYRPHLENRIPVESETQITIDFEK
jgi:TonB family protein